MKYTELALKIVDRYSDGTPRYLADICTEITADSIYVLRAIAEIDQRYAKVIIPKDYDPRKGPMIAISQSASKADRSILFGEKEHSESAPAPDSGFQFEDVQGHEFDFEDIEAEQFATEDSESETEGAGEFFQSMAQDIHMMVMLEMMCHQISTSATWMISAAENGSFAEEGESIVKVARKIMAMVGQLKG